MTLHVFNPSHDEALAANSPHYYPSTAARQTARAYAHLPACWAEKGDAVWIDAETPEKGEAFATEKEGFETDGITFLTTKQLTPALWKKVKKIEPWGWDYLLRQRLRKAGAPERILPTDEQIEEIRRLSSRTTTATLLPLLRHDLCERGIDTIGLSRIATSENEAEQWAAEWNGAYIKSLWSCSGRGVFRYTLPATPSAKGRLRKLIATRGAVEAEPIYNAVRDFALEFEMQGDKCRYSGLSVFGTNSGGQYLSNLVLPQEKLRSLLTPYIIGEEKEDKTTDQLTAVAEVCCKHLGRLLRDRYEGPVGIDMMFAEHEGRTFLHPCIEVNLRRTMGMAALYQAASNK